MISKLFACIDAITGYSSTVDGGTHEKAVDLLHRSSSRLCYSSVLLDQVKGDADFFFIGKVFHRLGIRFVVLLVEPRQKDFSPIAL